MEKIWKGLFDLNSNQLEWLKLIILPLMVFDHIFYIVDDNSLWRLPGRVVFPAFAFLVVYNLLYRTRDKKKYILRLSVVALISQPFFSLALTHTLFPLNVLFTLSLGSLLILIFDQWKVFEGQGMVYRFLFPTMVFILLILAMGVEFQIPGVLFMLALFFHLKIKLFFTFILLCIALFFVNGFSELILGLGGLFFLGLLVGIKRINCSAIRLNRWFFYLFYPVHLLILSKLFS